MGVSDLKSGQGKVDIEVLVKSLGEPRVFNKYGKELKVVNAVVSDETGEIAMTLWNADAEKVKAGDRIKVTNGYVSEFNGTKQLTSGKFGKLEIVGADGVSKPSEKAEKADKVEKRAKKKDEVEEVEF